MATTTGAIPSPADQPTRNGRTTLGIALAPRLYEPSDRVGGGNASPAERISTPAATCSSITALGRRGTATIAAPVFSSSRVRRRNTIASGSTGPYGTKNGRYPNVIIELSSPTTAEEDHTTRKDLYERTFRTEEYFIYDPFSKVLEGWRLIKRRYVRIEPNDRGWLWSEELELWVGTWQSEFQGHDELWLRFYDAEGKIAPRRGELERINAEFERRRAEAERRRAEAAEAELARSRQELAGRRPHWLVSRGRGMTGAGI